MTYDKLLDGYRKFRQTVYPELSALYQRLAREGQRPKVLMISCSDSRTDPSTLLCADPGELFVLRNVANIVPGYSPDGGHHGTASAIEFAVRSLGVEHIIVMGHAKCGGVEALLDYTEAEAGKTDFVHHWVVQAREARDRVLHDHAGASREEKLIHLEEENVHQSLIALETYPWIKDAVAAGKLALHGWRFDVEHGALSIYEPSTGRFVLADVGA